MVTALEQAIQNTHLIQSIPKNSIADASSFSLKQAQSVIEPKVMIVDDDVDCLRSLTELLNPWGFKVTTLADPQEFWTVLQSVLPDILVLDVNMPPINGLEICQSIRNDLNWKRLPVLFLSVMSDPNTQNLAFGVGADDYLCKPIVGIDLANRIHNRLQRVRDYQ